jgi:hypothetical protein
MTISIKHYSKQTDNLVTEAYWCSNGLLMITQHDADAKQTQYSYEGQRTAWFQGYEVNELLKNYEEGKDLLLDVDAVREDWVPHRERIVAERCGDGIKIRSVLAFPFCEEWLQQELSIEGVMVEGKRLPPNEFKTTAQELAEALGACSGPLSKVFRPST